MSADRCYETARDLLPVLELNRVTPYEVAGRRVSAPEVTEITSSMESMIGGEEGKSFVFRVRQRVKTVRLRLPLTSKRSTGSVSQVVKSRRRLRSSSPRRWPS